MCKDDDEIDEKRGSDAYAGQCAGCGRQMTNAQQSTEDPTYCNDCAEEYDDSADESDDSADESDN